MIDETANVTIRTDECRHAVLAARHDLRSTINTILGFSDLWLETGNAGSGASWQETIAHIKNLSSKMDRIVSDMLDLASIGVRDMHELKAYGQSIRKLIAQPADTIISHARQLLSRPDDSLPGGIKDDARTILNAVVTLLHDTDMLASRGGIASGGGLSGMAAPVVDGHSFCGFLHDRYPGAADEQVLLVDENANCSELLARRLRSLSINVTSVSNGDLAVRRLDAGSFTTVILNTDHRFMQDFALLERMRSRRSRGECTIIVIADHDQNGLILEALLRGADDYMPKNCAWQLAAVKICMHQRLRAQG